MAIKFNSYLGSTLASCGLLVGTLSFAATAGTEVFITPAPAPTHATAPAHAPAPAPTHLGQGETNISLALAKTELSKLGITHPTPAQLNAAQYGGTVTTRSGRRVQLVGVQTQRQSGMGWGQIAHSMGVKLGAVVSAAKSSGKHHDKEHAAQGRTGGEDHRHSTQHAQSSHDTRSTHTAAGTHLTGGMQRTSTSHSMHAQVGAVARSGGASTGGGAGGASGGGHGGSHK
jgi:hypothetical protein